MSDKNTSDKGKDKGKEKKTVQTMLAAKSFNRSQDKPPPPKMGRLASDRSSTSDCDLSVIQCDLDNIKDGLGQVLKKQDLDNALSNLVKKNDIESIVTNIVEKLVNNMKKEIDKSLREKLQKQTKAIEEITRENENLKETVASQRREIQDLANKVKDNEIRSKEAVEMGNYNEQYSRKFNVKVMNYPEKKDENLNEIFVKDIVKGALDVIIDQSDVQAIHRIPGKQGQPRPIIVKCRNSDVKSKIMREKKKLVRAGFKLVDDVTKQNMALITRLRNCEMLESAWYFNGSVYGKTESETRIRFNLFDDIEKKIREKK